MPNLADRKLCADEWEEARTNLRIYNNLTYIIAVLGKLINLSRAMVDVGITETGLMPTFEDVLRERAALHRERDFKPKDEPPYTVH